MKPGGLTSGYVGLEGSKLWTYACLSAAHDPHVLQKPRGCDFSQSHESRRPSEGFGIFLILGPACDSSAHGKPPTTVSLNISYYLTFSLNRLAFDDHDVVFHAFTLRPASKGASSRDASANPPQTRSSELLNAPLLKGLTFGTKIQMRITRRSQANADSATPRLKCRGSCTNPCASILHLQRD